MIEPKLLQARIEFLKNAKNIQEIQKGFSTDKKYLVSQRKGKKYLLRTASIDKYDRKKSEFNIYFEMQRLKTSVPRPIEVGKIEDLGICFYVLSYIEGKDARDELPHLTKQQQYKIGIAAGKDLAKMNILQAPSSIVPWYDRIMKKHKFYIEAYKNCGVKIKNDAKIFDFIEKNVKYIKARPNQFQHDDFHVGNIIVNDKKYAGVIDFDRCDWGDPYFEFLKVAVFSKEVSIPFSIGQLNGYFEKEIPEDFWLIYSIYTAMTVFSSVVWAQKVTPEKLDEMVERLYNVLEDHKDFDQVKPSWYEDVWY